MKSNNNKTIIEFHWRGTLGRVTRCRLGLEKVTDHGSSCVLSVVSPWQSVWSSGNTGTSALHDPTRGKEAQDVKQGNRNLRTESKGSYGASPSTPTESQHLTLVSGLASDVVEELGVVGEHASTGRAGHHLLLGVASQVLPQLETPFERGPAVWRPEHTDRALLRGTWLFLHSLYASQVPLPLIYQTLGTSILPSPFQPQRTKQSLSPGGTSMHRLCISTWR